MSVSGLPSSATVSPACDQLVTAVEDQHHGLQQSGSRVEAEAQLPLGRAVVT
jgi:hypothetical protein